MVRLNSLLVAVFGSLVVLGLLVAVLTRHPGERQNVSQKPPLFIYCGAGIRAPVEVAAKEYEKDYGVPILFQYGPSHTLVVQADLSKSGDLILPGDENYIDLAREKGLIDQSVSLARMRPTLAVMKGNPKNVRSLDDLLRPDVRLAQTMPEAAAAGKLVQEALQKSGDWDRIKAHTTVFKATVNDVASDIKVGAVDAGFVWDVLATQYPELELVPIPQLAKTSAMVSVGTLKSSSQTSVARHFVRYLAAKDKGLQMFKEFGFEPVDGELWVDAP